MSQSERMPRRQSHEPITWFYDLFQRELLDMDPPYQRRSVWSQRYKDAFVDTILLSFPAPAIFLFPNILPDGRVKHHVVDGKQRLSTIFEFLRGEYPASDKSEVQRLRGKYFSEMDEDTRMGVWSYLLPVEFLANNDEAVINRIFDRINRNVAKLTPQELRHARFEGEFIRAAEDLASALPVELPLALPNITPQSRRQMKDVELVAQLLLLLETGPRGYSTQQLDEAFSERDDDWPNKDDVVAKFRRTAGLLQELFSTPDGAELARSRYRNQADFYSLFGGVNNLADPHAAPPLLEWARRLRSFMAILESQPRLEATQKAREYYEAARSASNDTGPRQTRIRILEELLRGGLDGVLAA